MIESEAPVHGNAQVIQLLEVYLAKAKAGKVNYGLVAVCQEPGHGEYDVAGSVSMEDVALAALDHIREQIGKTRLNRTLPERDQTGPADRVCLNCTLYFGFDMVPWLIDQEMTRRREGAPDPRRAQVEQARQRAAQERDTARTSTLFLESANSPAPTRTSGLDMPPCPPGIRSRRPRAENRRSR